MCEYEDKYDELLDDFSRLEGKYDALREVTEDASTKESLQFRLSAAESREQWAKKSLERCKDKYERERRSLIAIESRTRSIKISNVYGFVQAFRDNVALSLNRVDKDRATVQAILDYHDLYWKGKLE